MRKFIKWWDNFIGWNLEALLLCCTACFIVVMMVVLFYKLIMIDGFKKRQARKDEDIVFRVEESQVMEDGSIKVLTSDGAVYILKISKEMNDNDN